MVTTKDGRLVICSVVTLIDGGFLYLQRSGHNNMGHCFNLPGGRLEQGEVPVHGAVRELGEETGIKVADTGLEKVIEFSTYGITKHNTKRDLWSIIFLLVKRDISLDSVSILPNEHEGKRIFGLAELRQLRETPATRSIKDNIKNPSGLVFTPMDSELLRKHFWVFEKAYAGQHGNVPG